MHSIRSLGQVVRDHKCGKTKEPRGFEGSFAVVSFMLAGTYTTILFYYTMGWVLNRHR